MKIIFGLLIFSATFAKLPVYQNPNEIEFYSFQENVENYEKKQFYLDPAPRGVDARYAWTIPGGTGENVKVIDIETSTNSKHVDFLDLKWVDGNFEDDIDGLNHGTAVRGIIAGKKDETGVTGIVYNVNYGFAGFKEGAGDYDQAYSIGILKSISDALTHLEAGDVMVIEQEVTGPTNEFIPPEFYDEIFLALKDVTSRGIHCVAAAGNGGANLDSPKFKGAFDLKTRDSGCIIVGAGTPNLIRESFSDYGSRIDTFGFGDSMTTTGYGSLYRNGENHNEDYTGSFNGTSSATPVVAGVVASLSSIAKAKGVKVSPSEMREALRNTGTPQKNPQDGRIGNLPDLKQLVEYLKLN